MNATIYTDGGSLNNPGQAAYAYVIYFDNTLQEKKGEAIGIATNNIAEYTGLIKALEKVKELKKNHQIDKIFVYADSELMVKQLNGLYKVKNGELQSKVFTVRGLEQEIGTPITYTHVLREKNTVADSLVKKALGR
jgi:ribonuclease HI